MNKLGEVLLITGPAGSGKSTLAQWISDNLGWENISEDEYWVKEGWGSGLRSAEQEKIIQERVVDDIVSICQLGRSAVLEFILYKDPPNPLTAYQEALSSKQIAFDVIALKPSIDEILTRIQKRGRPDDLIHLEQKRRDAENQIRYLESPYINADWIIDSTDIPVNDLADSAIRRLR
jgi:adenylate kinase family enzyme